MTWAALGFLGAALLFVLNSLFVPLLQKDLEEGVPWFAAWLVRRAVCKFPVEHQARFEEEWLAELTEIPGVMVFKLRFALCILFQARSTSRAIQGRPPWWKETLSRLAEPLTQALTLQAGALHRAHRKRSRRPSPVDWLAHSLRVLMAVIIGITVSEPLLLKAFEKEVKGLTGTDAPDYSISKAPRTVDKQAQLKLRSLSDREREILGLLADGWSNRRIAEECFLSLNTVRTHVQNVLVKLGVHSKLEAVAFALEHKRDIEPEDPR